MSEYGIITGALDVDMDESVELIIELPRLNSSNEVEYVAIIQTSRDMTGENVKMYGSLKELWDYMDENGQPPDEA